MSPSRTKRNQRRTRRAGMRARMQPKFSAIILEAWQHAGWVWAQFCELFHSPRALSLREYIARWEHRKFADWIRPLEFLTRRIIFAAGLAMAVVLKPLATRQPKPRKRRIRVVWPQKPETWIARFRMLPPQRPETRWIYSNRREVSPTMASFPLARRLEALRRVLADPEPAARRFAAKLARIAARNRTANEPRRLWIRPWDSSAARTHGTRIVSCTMDSLSPVIHDKLDIWNHPPEPG